MKLVTTPEYAQDKMETMARCISGHLNDLAQLVSETGEAILVSDKFHVEGKDYHVTLKLSETPEPEFAL